MLEKYILAVCPYQQKQTENKQIILSWVLG